MTSDWSTYNSILNADWLTGEPRPEQPGGPVRDGLPALPRERDRDLRVSHPEQVPPRQGGRQEDDSGQWQN